MTSSFFKFQMLTLPRLPAAPMMRGASGRKPAVKILPTPISLVNKQLNLDDEGSIDQILSDLSAEAVKNNEFPLISTPQKSIQVADLE